MTGSQVRVLFAAPFFPCGHLLDFRTLSGPRKTGQGEGTAAWRHVYVCAINPALTMSEHPSSVPSGNECAVRCRHRFVPVTAPCLSEPWSGAMSGPGKVHLGVSLLSAFTSTIAVALVLGLPMAVAIIWVCS